MKQALAVGGSDDTGAAGNDGGDTGPDGTDGDNGPGGGNAPGPASGPGGGGSSRQPGSGPGPSLAALVSITIPWSAYTGRAEGLADVGGFGVTDTADARDLAAAAGRDPRTRWCVTVLTPDRTAAAHGCVPGRHPPPGLHNLTITPGPAPPPGTSPHEWISQLGVQLTPVSRGSCTHEHAEPGYRPSRKLRHLIRARNDHCTAPGCGQPAVNCDLDHTLAWEHGGITCECDLAPLCRHHHRCKQAQGWRLEQPEPGVLIWHTPAGRTYTTGPTHYPA
jgi:hypothetical protein